MLRLYFTSFIPAHLVQVYAAGILFGLLKYSNNRYLRTFRNDILLAESQRLQYFYSALVAGIEAYGLFILSKRNRNMYKSCLNRFFPGVFSLFERGVQFIFLFYAMRTWQSLVTSEP